MATTPPADAKVGEPKKEDDMTVGEFIDQHALSSNTGKKDMNFQQLATKLDLSIKDVIDICKELGHKLPAGA